MRPLYISYAGPILLETPLLNKGSAFTLEERINFNLEGLLPYRIESIEEQADRAYQQLTTLEDPLSKHIYLRSIQDTNETLYYKLVVDHLEEIMPLIYTPTVGEACQQFSQIYRRKRGLFIAFPQINHIDDHLQNATKQNVKIIVVTDGERILGLGDQGIGGIGIPVGKLALYTACGGISPAYTLPVVLDVGCNNPDLINDPMYMGWRHPRITGDTYADFVDKFISAVRRRWPNVLLQFEDFAQTNATPLLERYRDQLCCFNDDIQGTAAVTVGALMAAARAKQQKLSDQTICFVGAGSAGCGIATQVMKAMMEEGLSLLEAKSRIYMVDRHGLLTEKTPDILPFQKELICSSEIIARWKLNADNIDLLTTLKHAKPSALIGVSGQPGLFNQAVIESMKSHSNRPIIFPLSNPTSRAEASPADILRWAGENAIVATGSPFEPVHIKGKLIHIPQCNNSYIFPGIGLGVLASQASRVTDNMLMAASRSLAEQVTIEHGAAVSLLPPIHMIRQVSFNIARAVAKQAMVDRVAVTLPEEALENQLKRNVWKPEYRHYRRTSF